MSAKWQKVAIEIPKDYGPIERKAIALEIVDFIRNRTQSKRVDKDGKPFASYSKSYVKSLDFKIGGKSKSKVDLTLSGDMLGALDLLSHKSGKIIVGFENGSQENARADGNIRGTYGNTKPVGPARDFLGISDEDLTKILKKYPVDRKSVSERRAAVKVAASEVAENPVETE